MLLSSTRFGGCTGLILFGLLLVMPGTVLAATLSLVEESSGYFRIEGAELESVAAIDMTINYDPASLRINQVTAGALANGMLFAGNAQNAGLVKIGAAGTRPASGGGVLARLVGAATGAQVSVSNFAAKLYDANGKSLPVKTRIDLLPVIYSPSTEESEASETSTSGGGVGLSSVTLPTPKGGSDAEPSGAGVPSETPSPLLPEIERGVAAPLAISTEGSGKALLKPVAVRERFAKFTGQRTLAGMTPLFDNANENLEQRPAILLSDGITPLELRLRLAARQKPSVALRNAKLLQAKFDADGYYLVRCLPTAGADIAAVILLDAQRLLTIPLTVAPPVAIPTIPDEKTPLPQLDLDGDGQHSWRDDYILVANLLAKSRDKTLSEKVVGSASPRPD